MAGETVTYVEQNYGSVKRITATWVSGDGGQSAQDFTAGVYNGEIVGLHTVPAGGGSAPTDNYDLTLLDSTGVDALAGAGADRDTANTEIVKSPNLGFVAGSKLALRVANAGNSKGGVAHIFIR